MKIAYVCADRGVRPAGSGGSATHVREVVRGLARRGHDVVVLSAAADGAEDALGCPVVDLQQFAPVRELRASIQKAAHACGDSSRAPQEAIALLLNHALAAALDAMAPAADLVYERQSLWSFAGLDHAKRRGIPHLLEVNAPLVEQQRAYRELSLEAVAAGIEEQIFSGTDRVLVTSPSLVEYARSRGASGRDVTVVPCGLPASLLDAGVADGPRNATRFVIGFVGTLKPWHGLDVLLKAFRELRERDFTYRLLIVGDGPMREEIAQYLQTHRLEPFCEMTGALPPEEIPAQLARMDVGVAPYPELPSFYFSPLKIWEYAGAGVPIAAAAVGELPEVFPHREAALLHRPGSVAKLVAHIEKLREDPTLGPRLARRARRTARAHTWDRIVARIETIALDAVTRRSEREGLPQDPPDLLG